MKTKKFVFVVLPLLLTSCAKTNELYKPNDYNNTDFDLNYYTEQNNVDKVEVINSKTFEAKSSDVFVSDPNSEHPNIAGLKDNDQYIFDNGEKKLLDWSLDVPIFDVGTGYGPTKCLSEIDKSFADGYLSKLYDGRVRCGGLYQLSRVQLTESGYSTFFPKELVSAKYFAMSMYNRTSPSLDGAFSNTYLYMDFELSFYQHTSVSNQYNKYTVKISNLAVRVNTGVFTDLMVFYFSDVLGSDYQKYLEGVTAMSLSYKKNSIFAKDSISQAQLEKDTAQYGDPSANKDEESNVHVALMLYEVLFPDSTWR